MEDSLGVASDERERGPQLVTDGRHEALAELLQRAGRGTSRIIAVARTGPPRSDGERE